MAEQRTLILGGARSGKSVAAVRLRASEPVVLYVATGGDDSGNAEWAARIAKQARTAEEAGSSLSPTEGS